MASEMKHTAKPISLVAVVDMNGGEALVLNRPLAYVYERDGNDYVGKDGPFKSRYAYERAHGRFVGFAGREIVLNMADGSMTTIKDHWWDNGMKGCVSVAANCIDVLKKCYVFFGCNHITPEDLAALRSTYTGCVYPYCEYEKLIKFDDTWKMVCHERNRVEALIAEVKDKSRKLNALAGIADPAAFVKRAKAIEEAASNAVPMMQMAWKQYGVGGMFECMDALRAALAKIGGGA